MKARFLGTDANDERDGLLRSFGEVVSERGLEVLDVGHSRRLRTDEHFGRGGWSRSLRLLLNLRLDLDLDRDLFLNLRGSGGR